MARNVPNFHTPPPYFGVKPSGKPVPPNVRVNLDYFRCLTAMDDCMGRLLAALDKAGLTSNTLVMFTSDNGFYLGAHATGDKRSAYEESLRVPLLVRYPALGPGAPGRLVDEMVLNLDHAPTMLDFAGVPVPKEMQGKSLRPLLSGEPVEWRQSWFYEYFTEDQKGTNIPVITAVCTTGAKLRKFRHQHRGLALPPLPRRRLGTLRQHGRSA